MQPFAALSLGVWAPVTQGNWDSSACGGLLVCFFVLVLLCGLIKGGFEMMTEYDQPFWPLPVVVVASLIVTGNVVNRYGRRFGEDFLTVVFFGMASTAGVCLLYIVIRKIVDAAKHKGGK
jgi:hypothetical protein